MFTGSKTVIVNTLPAVGFCFVSPAPVNLPHLFSDRGGLSAMCRPFISQH